MSIVRQRRCIGPEPDMTATKPQNPTSNGRRAGLDAVRHPSPGDRHVAVPPALARDIDRILLDHGADLPMSDIKAALAWLLSNSYGDASGVGRGVLRRPRLGRRTCLRTGTAVLSALGCGSFHL